MSLTAVWMTLNAEARGTGNRMTVSTPEDVDTLIAALSRPDSTAAMIDHTDRERTEFDGEELPDHDLTAGVWQDHGYLTYSDPAHAYASLEGDPASPAYPAHYVDYPAGTGVPVDVLTKALKEFLETAERPTCVSWTS